MRRRTTWGLAALLASCLACAPGCLATTGALAMARLANPHPRHPPRVGVTGPEVASAVVFALLFAPAVALDVATAPLQGLAVLVGERVGAFDERAPARQAPAPTAASPNTRR